MITEGFLTFHLSKQLNPNCTSIILDGELMGWHKSNENFSTKGHSFDVKRLVSTSKHQPCYVAYDILFYNNEVLIKKPYSERLKILQNAFTDKEGIIVHCTTKTVTKT